MILLREIKEINKDISHTMVSIPNGSKVLLIQLMDAFTKANTQSIEAKEKSDTLWKIFREYLKIRKELKLFFRKYLRYATGMNSVLSDCDIKRTYQYKLAIAKLNGWLVSSACAPLKQEIS